MAFMRGTIDEKGNFVSVEYQTIDRRGYFNRFGRFIPTRYSVGARGLLVMIARSPKGKVRHAEPCKVLAFRPTSLSATR
jgi:hypothetical protein